MASLSAAAALPPVSNAALLSRHVWVASLKSCGAMLLCCRRPIMLLLAGLRVCQPNRIERRESVRVSARHVSAAAGKPES